MRTKRVRKIVSSLNPAIAHRGGVWQCPYCDHTPKDHNQWDKTAVELVVAEICGKHGSIVVVSECPKCFKESWIHEGFQGFNDWRDDYPSDWKKAAQAEHARRHRIAVSRFADSLCAKCQHLRKLSCDTLPVVDCTYGKDENAKLPPGREFFMHHSFTETECPKFCPRQSAENREGEGHE